MGAVEPAYGDPRLAALYDALNPWGPSDDFYLSYVQGAGSALDLGCGTGALLCRARAEGHAGVLAGVDPAAAMLDVARTSRDDVTWLPGDAASFDAGRVFDLVTMTGHAFQVLLSDDAIRAALANVRRHLVPGGRFAFETRNPAARAWERWTPELSRRTGGGYDAWHEVTAVEGELVTFVATFRSAAETLTSTTTLRFAELDRLRALLAEAGLRVEEEYGAWDRSPIGPESPELVLVSSAVP